MHMITTWQQTVAICLDRQFF